VPNTCARGGVFVSLIYSTATICTFCSRHGANKNGLYAAPAPECSKQGDQRVLGGHMASVESETSKAWSSRRRGSRRRRRQGNGEGVSPAH